MLRRFALAALAVASVAAGTLPATAEAATFPKMIPLPTGFQPEGIATGRGDFFYVGSIPTGAVYRGDLRTGEGDVLVPGVTGRAATGLKEAGGLLYVAGAGTGKAFIYDARTGDDVAQVTLTTTAPTFVNDVVVTDEAAFFTDSANPVLYRVDRSTLDVTVIPLTGDLQYVAGFNVNGIEATAGGRILVLVQSNTGKLFKVEASTGVTKEIELAGGQTVSNGDGILLVDHTLYVVQNQQNVVAKVHLGPHFTSGIVVSRTGVPDFDVPTTVARFGNRLYAVNSRFGIPDPGNADFSVVGLRRP